ncbi:MAG: pilus assembly protein CpaC [Acetobacteraceae bacterium]|nr:pilus assembly protein CpaC [Acetobacteraceae bacterium]
MLSIRKVLAGAVIGWGCLTHLGAAVAQSPVDRGAITIQSGSGQVITFHNAAANVFVADPKVADVHPASPTSLFVFGVGVGRTTVAAMDTAGHLISQYEVTVQPSAFGAAEAQAAIVRLMPGSRVRTQAQARGMMLTGQVDNASDVAQAVAIAKGYLAENQTIDNQIIVQSQMQVTLRVRIAEMSRQVVQKLGINWQALGTIGSIAHLPALTLNANTDTVICTGTIGTLCPGTNFNGIIDALAQDNLAHVLTEPNLTVMSGQTASFLVGGEFPIPVGQNGGQVTIDFKKYGITLAFLPTVFSDGRINIHVSPEVSQITTLGAVQLTAGNSSIQVPALLVRRAETTVELGSGESFAIAGLLQDNIAQGTSGLPYLADVPVLGSLFRSSSFQRTETELVTVVTPFIVRPIRDSTAIHLPTDDAAVPNDLERVLLARQLARSPSGPPARIEIPGDAGFIVQ